MWRKSDVGRTCCNVFMAAPKDGVATVPCHPKDCIMNKTLRAVAIAALGAMLIILLNQVRALAPRNA